MLPVEIVLPATFAKLDPLNNSLLFQIIVLTRSGDIVLKGLIAGTAYPAPCPPGTFGAATTLQAANQCTSCTQGYYCPNAGMKTADLATTTYQCEAGYYCPTGSKSPRASACTAGHKCPAGSATQTACPNGYYQNNV